MYSGIWYNSYVKLAQVTEKRPYKKRKWKPSKFMQKFLTIATETDLTSITDICTAAGVSRQAWYKWKENPDFARWFKDEWDKRLMLSTVALDKKGLKYALMGNYKFWESMQKRIGNLSDNKGQNLTQINIQMPDWYKE